MKKIIPILVLLLIALIGIGIVYLNKVYLPLKLKSLVIQTIKEKTHKNVALESLRFNIFKGLVLRDLKIYDGNRQILSINEASCTFVIWPFFKKQLIIPHIKLKEAEILIQRRADGTFNLADFLSQEALTLPIPGWAILVNRFSLINSRVVFEDDFLQPTFTQTLRDFNLGVWFAFPGSVDFMLQGEIPFVTPTKIVSSGKYNLSQKDLTGVITIKDLSPQDFFGYYQGLIVQPVRGAIDASGNFRYKDQAVSLSLTALGKDIFLSQDNICAYLNSKVDAEIRYFLADKAFKYSGSAEISNLDVSGLEFAEKVEHLSGKVKFDNSGLTSDWLNAEIFSTPVQGKISLKDFTSPSVNLDLTAALPLKDLQVILKDKFNLGLPVETQGSADLSVNLKAKLPLSGPPDIDGVVDISAGSISAEKLKYPLYQINGRVNFTNQKAWLKDLEFSYMDSDYKLSGLVNDFKAPQGNLALYSKELSLESDYSLSGKAVNFNKCFGSYDNSDFSLSGSVDFTNVEQLQADISGNVKFNLKEAVRYFKGYAGQLDKIKPEGKIDITGKLKGNINDLKSCSIQVKANTPLLTAYGFRAADFSLECNQTDGIVDIPAAHFSFYAGTVELAGKMNLKSLNLPYWVGVRIQNVLLEKLKLDTASKDKDLAGTVNAEAKINGYSHDLAKLSGAGQVSVTDGKLWELNLFKGLGKILFAKDFAQINFHEAACGFAIQDQAVFTDNLKMKSNVAEINGSLKVGFDSSLGGLLNVSILSEMVPLKGTFKDVTTALVGQAGSYGTVQVSGTLQEPKFKPRIAAGDLIKEVGKEYINAIKDAIFGNKQ